jgi:hypothetical protein
MKRIAIVLDKSLMIGAVGNVSAILMGQLILRYPQIYSSELVIDKAGNEHAAIQFSTIVLKAGQTQILNLCNSIKIDYPDLIFFLFTETGQKLNNAFSEYKTKIASQHTKELLPVAMIIYGDDNDVRKATKKFSVL